MKDFILLIPYFNNPEGIITSLKSVYYPTHKFEVLIVDDGSKIPLNTDILKIEIAGITFNILRLPENVGVAKALNKGLDMLHSRKDYKYIARLDCGDSCSPNRFIEQVKCMDEHSEIGLLGTWCRFADSKSGKSYLYKTRTKHEDIIREMHFKCSFIHPTVMFRREILDTIGHYPENYPHAEDYAYFCRILHKFRGYVLPQNLVDIPISKNSVSYSNRKEQILTRKKIVSEMNDSIINKVLGLFYLEILSLLPISLVNRLKYLVK